MYKTYAIAVLAIATTSCATVLNRKTQNIKVYSNAQNARVIYNDTLLYDLPATIEVKRNNEPLILKLEQKDHLVDEYVFKHKISPMYIYANLATFPIYGGGYLIDLASKKRFAYKREVFLGMFDNSVDEETKVAIAKEAKQIADNTSWRNKVYQIDENGTAQAKEIKIIYKDNKYINPEKGTFNISVILPSIYSIGLSTKNPKISKFKNTTGLFSMGFGLDYFYSEKYFLSTEIVLRTNIITPIFFLDGNSYNNRIIGLDFALMHHHKINRWSVGYGIAYNRNNYSYTVEKEYTNEPYVVLMTDDGLRRRKQNYNTMGFSSLINYQLTPKFHAGIFYKPSVYSFRSTGNSFNYEHSVGMDLRFKF